MANGAPPSVFSSQGVYPQCFFFFFFFFHTCLNTCRSLMTSPCVCVTEEKPTFHAHGEKRHHRQQSRDTHVTSHQRKQTPPTEGKLPLNTTHLLHRGPRRNMRSVILSTYMGIPLSDGWVKTLPCRIWTATIATSLAARRKSRIEKHVGDKHFRWFRLVLLPRDGARNVGKLRPPTSELNSPLLQVDVLASKTKKEVGR